MQTQKAVDGLNELLRGELAAVETYQQAIEKVDNHPSLVYLRAIHEDHREAANEFRKHVHDIGGKPVQGSGAWGAFAKAVTGTAKVFGESAALLALKQGEEQGISSYEEALKNPDLPSECRSGLTSILKQGRAHVATLDKLMAEPKR
jgi:uncharacterized protein (TIGR02284 family)